MSDISRQSSPRVTPLSASPNRPSPLSRPHWPYTTYTHRPSSSAPSLNSIASSSSGSQAWDYRSSAGTPSPSGLVRRTSNLSMALSTNGGHDESQNTRHWSFTAFEWVVRDVHRLRDYVENINTVSDVEGCDFDILKESPMLGDGKFKLEIGIPPVTDRPDDLSTPLIRTQPAALSLYITSVMLEYATADYEILSSMFAGIKCQDDRIGERGARPDWVWEFWQNDWTYRADSEVWECPLPPLSILLDNSRIKETDSFVICVQIHCPIGPFFPQHPSASYVPKDLLDGLEALLDNANTGDVQFICLERQDETQVGDSVPSSPDTETPHSRRSSSSTPSLSPRAVARKRIIYAHSDILTRRSDYFSTMLNSAFLENTSVATATGERKIYTIVVEEADFVTIYWLLKWVYGNWLLFKEHDNPKAAIEGVGAGWSAKSLDPSGPTDEWAWRTLGKNTSFECGQDLMSINDTRSVASVASVEPALSPPGKLPLGSGHPTPSAQSSASSRPRAISSSTKGQQNSSSTRPPPSPTRRSTGAVPTPGNPNLLAPMSNPASSSTSPRGSKTLPLPPLTTTSTFPSSPRYPISPNKQRQRSRASGTAEPDPHPHPTPAPLPASALAMYQVAHRYGMPGLASLSLEHMMSTITPQSSFALLLASSIWDELHSLVEDYVVEKWDEVSVSSEFEQCCQEVAGGEWGPEGGKTLMALFRRLRSPNALGLTRT